MKQNLRIRICGLAMALLMPLGVAHAALISGLYNTGVDDNNVVLGDGVADSHYASGWVAITPDPAGGLPPGGYHGYWLANDSVSRWIGPAAVPTSDNSDTIRTFTLNFNIASGFDPATASVSGRYLTDNDGKVSFNGLSLPALNSSYRDWTSFSVTSGFHTGLNSLAFDVKNWGAGGENPTGLRVEFGSSSINVAAVPEPEIYAMMAIGLGMVGFLSRRRERQRAAA